MGPTDAVAFAGEEIIREYIEKYSNWGRWGADDQRGALNHVGPEQVRAAAVETTKGSLNRTRRWALATPVNSRHGASTR